MEKSKEKLRESLMACEHLQNTIINWTPEQFLELSQERDKSGFYMKQQPENQRRQNARDQEDAQVN